MGTFDQKGLVKDLYFNNSKYLFCFSPSKFVSIWNLFIDIYWFIENCVQNEYANILFSNLWWYYWWYIYKVLLIIFLSKCVSLLSLLLFLLISTHFCRVVLCGCMWQCWIVATLSFCDYLPWRVDLSSYKLL